MTESHGEWIGPYGSYTESDPQEGVLNLVKSELEPQYLPDETKECPPQSPYYAAGSYSVGNYPSASGVGDVPVDYSEMHDNAGKQALPEETRTSSPYSSLYAHQMSLSQATSRYLERYHSNTPPSSVDLQSRGYFGPAASASQSDAPTSSPSSNVNLMSPVESESHNPTISPTLKQESQNMHSYGDNQSAIQTMYGSYKRRQDDTVFQEGSVKRAPSPWGYGNDMRDYSVSSDFPMFNPYYHQEYSNYFGSGYSSQVGIPPQFSSYQSQWAGSPMAYSGPSYTPMPPIKYEQPKPRTTTCNSNNQNAERIRQENLKIEKYQRTLEPVGSITDTLLHIEKQLNLVINQLQFCEPVTHVYNPTDYAHEPHEDYIRKYCSSQKMILFLGMNPGPFGMAQNGVPFGEVNIVKDWLKVDGQIEKPKKEHPQRPILGFACTRSEVSGSRFWGMFRRLCITPERFFEHSFVHNYCPLALMSKTGKNITPPQLAKAHAGILTESCDQALCDVVKLLGVRVLIGIGKYAQERARTALKTYEPDLNIDIQTLMHPSPINPSANKGWEPVAEKQLRDMGVYEFIASADNLSEDNQDPETPSQGMTEVPLLPRSDRPTEICRSPFDDTPVT